MKTIKRILILTLSFAFILLMNMKNTLAVDYVPYKTYSGKELTYRGLSSRVMIPSKYVAKERELRAVWVSRFIGDIEFRNRSEYEQNFRRVLDKLEEYNMNAIIYHIRPNHDAMYESNLNVRSEYLRNVDPNWDSLAWAIEETHKRGIEFHAWLNPYRISGSNPGTISQITSNYSAPNPASKAKNILLGRFGNNQAAILNPGEPEVRDFLVDTVMEVVENYDIDAIHFDDYFYIDGVDDSATRNKYNPKGLNVHDWRREQIDIYIERVSTEIRNYNLNNNKYVQFGIAPTGVYKNGSPGPNGGPKGPDNYNANGDYITSGSNTRGQEHSQSYLYSDTKKWVDNEWIDYIMPQTYWGFEQAAAPYADIVDWWANVVRHKNVNLYTSMGIYMAEENVADSWKTNPYEASDQVLYNTKHEEVKGMSIFSYKRIVSPPSITRDGMNRIKNDYWANIALRPVVRTIARAPLEKVAGFEATKSQYGYSLSWTSLAGARAYAIYRNSGSIDFNDHTQIVDIIGDEKLSYYSVFNDTGNNEDYVYGIRAIDGANQLGAPVSFGEPIEDETIYNISLGDNYNQNLLSVDIASGVRGTRSLISRNAHPNYRYLFLTLNNKVITTSQNYHFYINSDELYYGYFVESHKIGVAFVNRNNDLISFQSVNNVDEINVPNIPPNQDGYQFSHWSVDIGTITKDTIVKAVYEPSKVESFVVTINDGNTTQTITKEYADKVVLTPHSSIRHNFSHWLVDGEITSYNEELVMSIYANTTIQAVTGSQTKSPLANIQKSAVRLNESSIAFVGSFYLPSHIDFIEVGMITYFGDINNFTFDTEGIVQTKALTISRNNEFAIIYRNIAQGAVTKSRTYLTYKDGDEVVTILSSITTNVNVSQGENTIQKHIDEIPKHITSDFSFPDIPGLTWSYAPGEDQSLFDLTRGKLLKRRLTTQVRTLQATMNNETVTFEVNFGVVGVDQTGSFYRNNPALLSREEGQSSDFYEWSGYTLTKGSTVHFISQVVEVSGQGLITDANMLKPTPRYPSLGSLYINTGNNTIRFKVSGIGTRIQNNSNYVQVLIGADGKIKELYKDALLSSFEIELKAGEAFWSPQYYDKLDGLVFANPLDFDAFEYLYVNKYN